MVTLADPVPVAKGGGDTRDVREMIRIGPAASVREHHVVLVAVRRGRLQQLWQRPRPGLVDLHRFTEDLLLGQLEGTARGE